MNASRRRRQIRLELDRLRMPTDPGFVNRAVDYIADGHAPTPEAAARMVAAWYRTELGEAIRRLNDETGPDL